MPSKKEDIKNTFMTVGKDKFNYSKEADNDYKDDEIDKICSNIEYILNNPDFDLEGSSSENDNSSIPGKLYLNGTMGYNLKNDDKVYFPITFIYKYINVDYIEDTKEQDGNKVNYTISPAEHTGSLLMGNNREDIYTIIINAYDKDFLSNLCKLVHKECEKMNYIKRVNNLFIPDYKAINKDFPYYFEEDINSYLDQVSQKLEQNNYKGLEQDNTYIYIPEYTYLCRQGM